MSLNEKIKKVVFLRSYSKKMEEFANGLGRNSELNTETKQVEELVGFFFREITKSSQVNREETSNSLTSSSNHSPHLQTQRDLSLDNDETDTSMFNGNNQLFIYKEEIASVKKLFVESSDNLMTIFNLLIFLNDLLKDFEFKEGHFYENIFVANLRQILKKKDNNKSVLDSMFLEIRNFNIQLEDILNKFEKEKCSLSELENLRDFSLKVKQEILEHFNFSYFMNNIFEAFRRCDFEDKQDDVMIIFTRLRMIYFSLEAILV